MDDEHDDDFVAGLFAGLATATAFWCLTFVLAALFVATFR